MTSKIPSDSRVNSARSHLNNHAHDHLLRPTSDPSLFTEPNDSGIGIVTTLKTHYSSLPASSDDTV